jgi:hypothetical protein
VNDQNFYIIIMQCWTDYFSDLAMWYLFAACHGNVVKLVIKTANINNTSPGFLLFILCLAVKILGKNSCVSAQCYCYLF